MKSAVQDLNAIHRRVVLVRCGSNGTQIAVELDRRGAGFLGTASHGPQVKLIKWRAQSRKWTQPGWYPAELVIGDCPPNDPRRRKAGVP